MFNNNHKLKLKSRRNRAALKKLRKLGFLMPDIRRALLRLNRIECKDLVDGEIANSTMTYTLDDKYQKRNKIAVVKISEALGLRPHELFQD